jgi:hypothetical protein
MRIGSDEISEQTDRMGMNSTFHMGKLGWDWSPQTRLSNSAQYSLMWYGENYSVFGYMKIESRIWLHHIRDEFKCKIGERSSINAGIDAQFISDDFIMVLPGSNNSINRDTTENWEFGVMGAYLNFEWKPFENVSIIPGLRYDYFPELNYDGSHLPAFWNYHAFDNNRGYSGEPSLRVNGRYEFIEDHTLKAAVGNYSQTPEPMGWVIHKTWGNPELPTTKAAHYVAGYEWQITDIINADVQIYYNNQWDIPEMVSADGLSTASGVNNSWLNSGKGRMYGLEIMLRHLQSERFFGWLAYTLSRSERYDQVHKKWVLFDDDETHHLQVLGSWHLKKNFDAGFRLRYVQGKPTTPIVGITENENLNGAMSIKPNYGDKNSKRINPFFGLDLKVDKKLVFDKWMFTIYADLQNISWLVYKSPETEFYNYDYTDKTTFSMFPMLSIGCKAEF